MVIISADHLSGLLKINFLNKLYHLKPKESEINKQYKETYHKPVNLKYGMKLLEIYTIELKVVHSEVWHSWGIDEHS